ncbi:MAG TPA: isoprenylcysteine carboxylmethyltransferase family protein [Gemmatimonadaceae bacterium]|jgi:protein-S-isoprenylcysteine O-methyltransferase Ste14|nr:isoprenylcysteine carboxylmethyltransferase family protein [Gemmatimonadaceae bacterium]
MMLLRHLLSVAALPFMVTIVIPVWLARRNAVTVGVAGSVPPMLLQVVGVGVLGIGLALFASSLRRFATEGEGTLAPWDPPRRLVVRGPYRYVRNPMISGVLLILFAEAMLLLSRAHLMWALTFLAMNALWIPLFEEPQLAGRFGEDYEEYRRNVPRLVPRLRPWEARPHALGQNKEP